MRGRQPLVPQRRRHVPPQFSWIDHRLIRDGHIEGRSAESLALYLFLVSVSDAEGLSWYSDPGLCRVLSWTPSALSRARGELVTAELIAYRKPLYQVLDLSPVSVAAQRAQRVSGSGAASIGNILQGLVSGGAQ